jgi:beta-mannosidase
VKNRPNDRPRAFYEFGAFQSVDATLDIWATNSNLSTKDVHFELFAIDLESDWSSSESHTITLAPNSSTEIAGAMRCPHKYTSNSASIIPTPSHSVVIAAFLRDDIGAVLAQFVNWPEPLKFIEPRDPKIHLTLEGDVLIVNVEHPVKGLVFSVQGGEDDVVWSDNCIDVVPKHAYTLEVTGLQGRPISVAYLGHEKATCAPDSEITGFTH